MNEIIQIIDLKFSYSKGETILDIPDFKIESGSKVFLHGPSGSGKTTLLSVLSGILIPKTGQVTLLGQNLSLLKGGELDRFRGNHMGYIFQMFNLIPYLSVMQNILLPLRFNALRKSRIQDGEKQEAERLATGLGMQTLLHRQVTDLSVGQQQRVAAARALIGSPEIIIADEPTSALDQDAREEFISLLFDQCSRIGSTLVFVSHDKTLARLFDRNISLKDINRAAR